MTITRLEPIPMIYSHDTDPVSRVINAIWANDWDDMKSIINEHPNCVNGTTWDNETALSLCVEYTEGAIYLIDHGANINSRSIYVAVMKNSVEVLKYMLAKLGPNNDIIYRHRDDVNKVCNLNRAAYDGHVEIIRVLLDYGMNINEGTSVKSNRYPITEAAWMDKTECVKYLVECGADINQQGMDADWSVLSLAVENNNVELVKFLVEKGADVNIKDIFGRPPLYHATVKGYPNLITYLVANGADENVIITCLENDKDDEDDEDDENDENNETVINETVIDETTLIEFHNKKLLDGEFEASHYTTNDEDNLIYERYTIYLVKNVIQQNKYKYKFKNWIAEWWINLYKIKYDPTSRHPPDNRFWQEMCDNPLAAFLFNNTTHLRHLMNSTQECDFEKKPNFGELLDLFVKMHEIEEDTKYIQWFKLASNPHPSAIRLIERNMDKLEDEESSDADCFCLRHLCYNPNAIHIIEQHIDKLNDKEWYILCSNPNAISLLEKFSEKINWDQLCLNPNAIHMIEPNLDKLCYSSWCNLCENPKAISIIEEYIDKLNDTNWIIHINAQHGEASVGTPSLQHFIHLCENPKTVHIIEKHIDKLCPKSWNKLCYNPNAMHIIEQHIEKVNYECLLTLCGNSNAMHIIEHLIDIKRLDELCWNSLCDNTSALPFLEQHPNKLHENILSNPSIFELVSIYSNNVD